jgi:putative Mg2+ transporter-C (MgtC) family protein
MAADSLRIVLHLVVAFILTFALGFERELRGSPAGDRTFSMIGLGTALVGILSRHGAPFALAGAVTGVGFIGGGLTFRQSTKQGDVLRGLPTAAAIFAAAAVGAAAGYGAVLAAVTGTVLILIVLEWRHIPGLKVLDARRWASRVTNDEVADVGPSGTSKPDEEGPPSARPGG